MLPDIHRATQKFYIFLIVYLTGCTPYKECEITSACSYFTNLLGNLEMGAGRIGNLFLLQ